MHMKYWKALLLCGLVLTTAVVIIVARRSWKSPLPNVTVVESTSKPSAVTARRPDAASPPNSLPETATRSVIYVERPLSPESPALASDPSSDANPYQLRRGIVETPWTTTAGQVSDLLRQAHPQMPEETAQTVAAVVCNALYSRLPQQLSSEQKTLLSTSIEAVRAEFASLPMSKGPEHLEWSVDYLEQQAYGWGAVFTELTSGRYQTADPSAATEQARTLAQEHYSQITGGLSTDIAVLEGFCHDVGTVEAQYFSPHGRFPLSEQSQQELRRALDEAVAKARTEIQARIANLDDRVPPDLRQSAVQEIVTTEAITVFPVIYSAYKQTVPRGFWEHVREALPADYDQRSVELNKRFAELCKRDNQALLNRAADDKFRVPIVADMRQDLERNLDSSIQGLGD